MKKIIISVIALIPFVLIAQINLGGVKVPYTSACGSLGTYSCQAQGKGSLGSYSSYEKKRVDLAGTEHFNLGRLLDRKSYNNTKPALIITNDDYVINTDTIKIDLKKTLLVDFLADVKVKMENKKINASIIDTVEAKLYANLAKSIKVSVKYSIATLKQNVVDEIEAFAENGSSHEHNKLFKQ
jgi:hypothetical protein